MLNNKKIAALSFIIVIFIGFIIIQVNKFQIVKETLSHTIVRVTNVDRIINDSFVYNGTDMILITDNDWKLTFNNKEVYREIKDAKPSIGDLYNRDVVKYSTIKKQTQEVVSTKKKIEYSQVEEQT